MKLKGSGVYSEHYFVSYSASNAEGHLLLIQGKFICRDKKLAAIKVNKEDVDIIAAEFELDTKTADRRLREHSGNLVEALQSFL